MKLSLNALVSSVSLTLAGAAIVILLYLAGLPFLNLIELKTYDLRLRAHRSPAPSPAVALAVIDEKSLGEMGRWPWPRERIATLIRRLNEAGAAVIGLTISFVEPEDVAGKPLAEALRREMVDNGLLPETAAAIIDTSRQKASGDRALAAAIASSAAPVVLGYFFIMETEGGKPLPPGSGNDGQTQEEQGLSSRISFIRYAGQETSPVPAPRARAAESNLPLLSAATPHAGHVNVDADEDGIARWLPLVIQSGADLYPGLALECARHYLGSGTTIVEAAPHGVSAIRLEKIRIPTDHAGRLLIRHLGKEGVFPHYPVSDIVNDRLPPGALKDKIVLVGATALGTFNAVNTPFAAGGAYPGLEVHAAVTSSILGQQFLERPGWTRFFDLAMIMALAFLTGWSASRLKALSGSLVLLGLVVAHLFMADTLFVRAGIWISIVYPLVALLTTGTLVMVYRRRREEREKKKIRSAFSRYAPPAVVTEILKNPGKLTLGGEERVLTVLFSDIAGFTTYSEKLPPDRMVALLSEYFDAMTARVFDHQGMLKEYVGDELMAIFGAPMAREDHARAACAAALSMQQRLAEMRRRWRRQGLPPLTARTGVNSGAMLVGNLGSSYRFSYGVLGDAVNLGSRLEGLNKMYGTRILMGETTAQEVQNDFLLREVDRVTVKGKTQPTAVFELLAEGGKPASDQDARALTAYAAALSAYRGRQWQQAISAFKATLSLWPQDGPAKVMQDRCRQFQHLPPPEDWQGEFLPDHK